MIQLLARSLAALLSLIVFAVVFGLVMQHSSADPWRIKFGAALAGAAFGAALIDWVIGKREDQ